RLLNNSGIMDHIPNGIINLVCFEMNCTRDEILSRSKDDPLCIRREICGYLIKKHCPWYDDKGVASFLKRGPQFTGRAVRSVKKHMRKSPAYKSLVRSLEMSLKVQLEEKSQHV
ncbi:MAG: hypothetical protein NXI20_28375, partial [bacterium]|nr:hypothetical protein [bacterium]